MSRSTTANEFASTRANSSRVVTTFSSRSATSFASVCQQLSLSLGVTLGALALEGTAAWHGRAQIEAGDFGPAFFVVAMISAASVLGFRKLVPDAGAEISGRTTAAAPPPVAEMKPRHG